MKYLVRLIILILALTSINAQQKRAMTVEDMWNMKRVGSFDISPDGKTIAFAATSYNMETNKSNSDIWLIDVDGKNIHAFKNSDVSESSPKFSPDGKKIAYSKKGQIWISNVDGSDDQQLTDLYTGASEMVWSNDGKKILFVSDVYPDCPTQDCNKQKDEAAEKNLVKASIITELMYRNFDHWRGEKRSHLFLYDLATKEYVDLTFGSTFEVPPVDLGSDNDYSFSPDGKEVAFTMNTDKVVATSTNNDIFVIKLDEVKKNSVTPYKLISKSKGSDSQPVYSPDGKYIAFTSMARSGFEADKKSIVLYNCATGVLKNLTEKIDVTAGQIIWSPDSKYIYFDAPNEVYNSIYKINIGTGKNEVVVKENGNSALAISPDGQTLFFKKQKSTLPYEIFSVNANGGTLKQLTFVNKDLLSQLEMSDIETFWSNGANGAKVQSILVKPPFFDPAKKYPLIFLIHGGPQGHWLDDFHYRWNVQMFAAKGYVVVATNPRGSQGYGQKFCDEISRDWGGKVYTDLMNACDYAIKNYKFIDPKNTFAAGASYGGYMINWLEGHTTRFNAVVSHDGVFNLESMTGSTEELWFPLWEYGGTYWNNRTDYEKFSPNRFVKNFKTPMLIVHSGHDFRVPEGQAMELFTALQLMNVESKFLYFPDETHFVQKAQNARLWWSTVFDWFNEHKK
ncbi:MAG: S9 family peptidase [Ignavibacteriales bacterium]|nr:S9 family peptidase [Ignavibacteriales bacterium]